VFSRGEAETAFGSRKFQMIFKGIGILVVLVAPVRFPLQSLGFFSFGKSERNSLIKAQRASSVGVEPCMYLVACSI
jgi:hypothetical protein